VLGWRIVCIGLVVVCGAAGGRCAESGRTLTVASLADAPRIDGSLEDSEWRGATVLDSRFIQLEPDFGEASPFRTVVRIAQTETALYVAFEAFDPDISRLSTAVTRRDGDFDDDDAVAIGLDTFGNSRTAYAFAANALGTQWDASINNNGRTVDDLWDAAWSCAARRSDDRWTIEFEIPFEILKFKSGADRAWGLTFVRFVPRRLETSVWPGPTEFEWRVSSFGVLDGLELAGEREKTWQLIPYGLAAVNDEGESDFEVGGDFRWKPTRSLGVDLTVNPDFALIEADVEVINLSRFELFIPEKRPFFLEGNEMYSQRIRQFYSRRIGDITWGGKTTGTLGNTSFSAIATSEDLAADADSSSPRADYGVVRLQHSLFKGSTIGLLAANRRQQGADQGSVGLDTTIFFTETLGLTAQLLTVHGDEADGGLAWFVRPAYDSASTHFHVRFTNLDRAIRDDFNAVGFLRDDNRREFDTNFTRRFWVQRGAVEKVRAGINYNRYDGQDGVLRSWVLDAEVDVTFRSGWEIEIEHIDEYKLFEKSFRNNRTVLTGGWDSRTGTSFSVFAGTGENFDSDLTLYGGELEWAVGDSLRLEYSLTRLELAPDPENDTTWIHVVNGVYYLHPDLYFKLFIQTNTAIDKLNIQAAWVWRFMPPFGAVQVAYQQGTSDVGQESEQGHTLFTKLSWVF
jgi:hypothetical protein